MFKKAIQAFRSWRIRRAFQQARPGVEFCQGEDGCIYVARVLFR